MIVTLAAARSRAAEKITPVDQPGGCRSYLQGMPGVDAGPLPSATRSARYQPSARGVDDPRIIMIWR
jgi:hypothetical protein